MFLYPSPEEAVAWLRGSDDDWAAVARGLYDAAVERGKGEAPADDTAS